MVFRFVFFLGWLFLFPISKPWLVFVWFLSTVFLLLIVFVSCFCIPFDCFDFGPLEEERNTIEYAIQYKEQLEEKDRKTIALLENKRVLRVFVLIYLLSSVISFLRLRNHCQNERHVVRKRAKRKSHLEEMDSVVSKQPKNHSSFQKTLPTPATNHKRLKVHNN